MRAAGRVAVAVAGVAPEGGRVDFTRAAGGDAPVQSWEVPAVTLRVDAASSQNDPTSDWMVAGLVTPSAGDADE